jgi:hypothetical protein
MSPASSDAHACGVEKDISIAGDQKVIYIPATAPDCAASFTAEVGRVRILVRMSSAAQTQQDMAEEIGFFSWNSSNTRQNHVPDFASFT